MNNGLVFEQFVEMVKLSLVVDVKANKLELVYRRLALAGSIRFMPIPIPNK